MGNEAERAEPAIRSIDFHGRAGEYFGIWISNLFLSIVTLGIYSAWAKVRRVRYFYNATRIQGTPFSYHATGKQILIGRVVSCVVIAVYTLITTFVPLAVLPFSIAFAIALPWLINRSLRFQARMTSWRNVRFDWHGTYGKNFLFFLVCPLVAMLSLGLLMPPISRATYRYFAESHAFGVTRFRTRATVAAYYKAFLAALVLPVAAAVAVGAAVALTQPGFAAGGWLGLLPFLMVPAFAFLFMFQVMYRVACRNILLRSMTLGDAVTFDSRLGPLRVLWIALSNAVAILFSLGLLVPWAMVRTYRYQAENTGVGLADDAPAFLDAQTQAVGAFGEEFMDLEGLEFGI